MNVERGDVVMVDLVTIDRRIILNVRGKFLAALMQQIDACLKAALDVS